MIHVAALLGFAAFFLVWPPGASAATRAGPTDEARMSDKLEPARARARCATSGCVLPGRPRLPAGLRPRPAARDWLAVVGWLLAFLPIYFATFRARSDRQVLLIAAMVALAAGGVLVNSGTAVFVIYAPRWPPGSSRCGEPSW